MLYEERGGKSYYYSLHLGHSRSWSWWRCLKTLHIMSFLNWIWQINEGERVGDGEGNIKAEEQYISTSYKQEIQFLWGWPIITKLLKRLNLKHSCLAVYVPVQSRAYVLFRLFVSFFCRIIIIYNYGIYYIYCVEVIKSRVWPANVFKW